MASAFEREDQFETERTCKGDELNTCSLLDAALAYAASGCAVFPVYTANADGSCSCSNAGCKRVGKHPLSSLVAGGHLDATADRATIQQWWALYPDANIGIALAGSGLVVVAPDSIEWLDAFQAEGLPDTFHTRTGGGAGHEQFYYQRPEGCPTHRICRSKEFDIVSDGYVIAPPSRHRSGLHCRAITKLPSDLRNLPTAPEWVVARLRDAKQGRTPQRVVFADSDTDGEDIYESVRPRLSARVQALIETGPQAGDDRSQLDAVVVTALIANDLNADDIRSIYRSYPIGTDSKYGERGDPYLAVTIENMRQHADSRVPDSAPQSVESNANSPTVAPLETVGALRRANLVPMRDVSPSIVQWLWVNRIPYGKITVLDGDPGTGKSLITLDIAARVSKYDKMPDGTLGDRYDTLNVLLISYEDDLSDTIRPRLEAAHADLDRVSVLNSISEVNGSARPVELPGDIPLIKEIVRESNTGLVVIDPLMAALASQVDSHRDQDIRRALAPLKELAEETGAAVLMVRHLNKGTSTNAVHRGGGSIGIIGAARAGLMAVKHPEDETKRILSVAKMNVGREAPSLIYRIEEGPSGHPHVVWEGETSLTANEALRALSGNATLTETERARDFLKTFLGDGPRPHAEVVHEARSRGISERTLERAKVGLADSVKRGFANQGGWCWQLVPSPSDNRPWEGPTTVPF